MMADAEVTGEQNIDSLHCLPYPPVFKGTRRPTMAADMYKRSGIVYTNAALTMALPLNFSARYYLSIVTKSHKQQQ